MCHVSLRAERSNLTVNISDFASSVRSLAQTGIINETTCLEPVAPLAQTGFFPLGMVQLMSRQGGQGGPRNDEKKYQ